MAGNQLSRKGAGALDIEDWMARRRADVQRLVDGAETAGRELWVQSTKSGQNFSAPNPGDVKALGARYLDARARASGGSTARLLGNAAGVVRAGVHSAQGVEDQFALAGRVLNPLDRVLAPPARAPLQPMMTAAGKAVDYSFNAFAHPASLVGDIRDQLQKWNTELNPAATPQADTVAGELVRNFRIGMNQGETVADAAALGFGSGALKVVPRLAPISEAAQTTKFIDQGFEPDVAKHLAQPYEGMGHHAVFPRRFTFPEAFLVPLPRSLAGRPLPPAWSNSPLNVLKPGNMSRGDFYALHYQVDPEMERSRLPPRFGGSWNGKALGLKEFGLLGRLWHGTPAALNTVVGLAGVSSLEADAKANGDRPR